MNNRKQSFTTKEDNLIWEGMLGHKYTSPPRIEPGEAHVLRGTGNTIYVYRPVTSINVPAEYIVVNAELDETGTTVLAYVEDRAKEPGTQELIKFDASSGSVKVSHDVQSDDDTTIMPGDPDATKLPSRNMDETGLDLPGELKP